MASYSETVDFLLTQLPMFSRQGATALKKDLTNIRALCDALGNPQEKFKSIHIGGTNGKGSASHMLAAVLQKSGYKTGLYTSPHLIDFRERIKINGHMATKEFIIEFVRKNQHLIRQIQPSFFEITVAMAFDWFALQEVDMAVVEVGLGGRLDSTNILNPVLSVITNISFDHKHILGNTLKEIAGEKAGIIKPGIPVVIGETQAEIKPVFIEKTAQCGAPIHFADQERKTVALDHRKGKLVVGVQKQGENKTQSYTLDLAGNYQAKNLLTVLAATDLLQKEGWAITEKIIRTALTEVKKLTGLRGRWEVLFTHPLTVADVAHNPGGISQVMEQIKALSFRQLFILTGFVKDKDVNDILDLFPKKAAYFFCQADVPRALSAKELSDIAAKKGLSGEICPRVNVALKKAQKAASPEDVILICGSVFLIAEVLAQHKLPE